MEQFSKPKTADGQGMSEGLQRLQAFWKKVDEAQKRKKEQDYKEFYFAFPGIKKDDRAIRHILWQLREEMMTDARWMAKAGKDAWPKWRDVREHLFMLFKEAGLMEGAA